VDVFGVGPPPPRPTTYFIGGLGHLIKTMKRRDFLRIFLLGIILALFGKKVKAENNPPTKPKEAMFWRKLD